MENLSDFNLNKDPLISFLDWYQSATKNDPNPEAMSLATVGASGIPYNRTVLFKGVREGKIIFYTNYHSSKGEQLSANPNVSLLFYWINELRQIRINGKVEKMSREDSIKYFESRDRESQIASYISNQSQKVESKEKMVEKFLKAQKDFENKPIPTPEHWGGYLVTPSEFEFFIYGKNRLNDRFLYEPNKGQWNCSRLQP